VPSGPTSPARGTATTERIPVSTTKARAASSRSNRSSVRVVVRAHRPLFLERPAGDSLTGLEAAGLGPLGYDAHRLARCVGPAQGLDQRVVEVDPRAIRGEEAGGLFDDLLEDLGGVEDGRDAGRDLAQGLFRIGPSGDLSTRLLELEDQAGVGDGHRSLVGQGGQQTRAGDIEGVAPGAVDGDRSDDDLAVDERRGDDRVDPALAHERVARLRMREALIVEVRPGPLDVAGLDGPAGKRRRRVTGVTSLRSSRLETARRPASWLVQASAIPVPPTRVDHRAGRSQQGDRSVDHRLQDLVLVAHRADLGRDPAQGPFRLGGAGQFAARCRQLVDEPGVGQGDGRLVGDDREETGIGLGPGVEPAGEDGQGPERSTLGDQGGPT